MFCDPYLEAGNETRSKTAPISMVYDTFSDPTIEIRSKSAPITSPKTKLRAALKNLRKKNKRLEIKNATLKGSFSGKSINKEEFINMCDTFLPDNISNFVKMQVVLADRKCRGERYTKAFKQFALTLYFLSPKCYRFLKKIFRLPSKCTLSLITRNWQYSPGINNNLFEALKIKIKNFTEMERHVTLCIDEIQIKPFLFYNISTDEIIGFDNNKKADSVRINCCNHAMVLMTSGICKQFKQPLAYLFSKGAYTDKDLDSLVKEAIRKLREIGLIVDVFISDMGSNLVALSKRLGVTPDTPFFMLDELKVHFMFDPPHLLKAVRNNLFSNVFQYQNKTTNWKYIREFYEKDKEMPFRLAPKLSEKHMNPTAFKKMKVKFATQVLSHSVASAISTYVSLKALPEDAMDTVYIIDKFDKLMDIFNADNILAAKKHRTAFSGEEFKVQFLEETSEFLKTLKVVSKDLSKNKTNIVSFIDGWRISINSLLNLWHDLKEVGFKFILTRRLSQDCLENYFGTIRQQNGNAVNPTPIQFVRSFKKTFCMKFLEHVGGGANCEDDFNQLLLNINEMGTFDKLLKANDEDVNGLDDDEPEKHDVKFNNELKSIKISTTDFNDLNLIAFNGIQYVSGYFAKKIISKHACKICEEGISSHIDSEDSSHTYLEKKLYEDLGEGKGLICPSKNWTEYITKIEDIYMEHFQQNMHKPNILKTILKKLLEVTFESKCSKFPTIYFLKLFIRTRIYFTLIFINQKLKSNEKNIKLLKLTNEI